MVAETHGGFWTSTHTEDWEAHLQTSLDGDSLAAQDATRRLEAKFRRFIKNKRVGMTKSIILQVDTRNASSFIGGEQISNTLLQGKKAKSQKSFMEDQWVGCCADTWQIFRSSYL